ncbi:MAG: DUF373 family protein [Thermoproteus sp. AZ2]|uniref:DUF373 family protein n=1 Tax=Thermoproteus sp. AZ2 TaxID=1609232 RepID=A0ACC6V3W7_9CREN|nr:MAG: multidrug ABC transporter permease [Thermoproteus sp. AZ2]
MRVLVLYVDRDGDLKQADIKTPVVGRDDVLRLGIQYILRHPDDSDANAIFGAINVYDKLVERLGRENVEVAVVCGSPDERIANIVVLDELNKVLSIFDADAIHFVSDGPSDEAAIPAIQTRRPVIAVERIIVKQSRSVEETVSLIRYYLSKAVRDPAYRKYTVGIPSFLLFLYALSISINMPIISYILEMGILFVLFLLFMYGFGIYDFLRSALKRYEATFTVSVISLFVTIIYLILVLSGISGVKLIYNPLVPALTLTAPLISYMVEGFLDHKYITKSSIILSILVFSFFDLIVPPIIDSIITKVFQVQSILANILIFSAVVLAGILVSLLAARALPRIIK